MRIRLRHILGSLLIACLSLFPSLGSGEDVVVVRNVNLRRDPSISQPPIRLLRPPDKVDLLEPQPTNDYYHVRTEDDEEGWVWIRNVRIVPEDEPSPTTVLMAPGAAAPSAASTGIDASWEKPEPVSKTYTSGGKSCGPGGSGGDTATNRRKNRVDIPAAYHDVTFDAITGLPAPDPAPKSRLKWSDEQLAVIRPYEGVAVRVVGHLAAIKPQNHGSGESTNCYWTTAAETDWHVALVKKEGHGEEKAIVVETTPRVRRAHAKWTKGRLDPWVDSDAPVRISGWLMYDPQHKNHMGRYRMTLWEIHPITKMEVFKDGTWRDLDTLP